MSGLGTGGVLKRHVFRAVPQQDDKGFKSWPTLKQKGLIHLMRNKFMCLVMDRLEVKPVTWMSGLFFYFRLV